MNTGRRTTVSLYWLCAALVVAGFVLMGFAWRGAARTLSVPLQIPYLVSGGLGGFACIVVGTGLFTVQLGRQLVAEECRDLDRLLSGSTTTGDDVVAGDDDAAQPAGHTA